MSAVYAHFDLIYSIDKSIIYSSQCKPTLNDSEQNTVESSTYDLYHDACMQTAAQYFSFYDDRMLSYRGGYARRSVSVGVAATLHEKSHLKRLAGYSHLIESIEKV